MLRSPPKLALGLGIRSAPHLGHHDNQRPTTEKPPEPHRRTKRGLAPIVAANAASHSATGAGSSSTMLQARPPRSTAATVAAAASLTCPTTRLRSPVPRSGTCGHGPSPGKSDWNYLGERMSAGDVVGRLTACRSACCVKQVPPEGVTPPLTTAEHGYPVPGGDADLPAERATARQGGKRRWVR
jgi:hypothetical protein